MAGPSQQHADGLAHRIGLWCALSAVQGLGFRVGCALSAVHTLVWARGAGQG